MTPVRPSPILPRLSIASALALASVGLGGCGNSDESGTVRLAPQQGAEASPRPPELSPAAARRAAAPDGRPRKARVNDPS